MVRKKADLSGPALPGKLADCTAQDLNRTELFPCRRGFGGRPSQAGARSRISGDHAAEGQDP
ncbi:hypothetical protein LNQ52_13400 [Klebsiella pneumoniae subsp. pneumoniae]|nr:hypothetical protein [Klebsiella pneumoniae subsp. pneumoniae]